MAPHLRKAHQMSAFEYRDRWSIPRQQALASISHRATCRSNIMARINHGELCLDAQIKMMRQAAITRQKSKAMIRLWRRC
ncbi:hypothetical protein [Candidatus Pantoea bituminis]|uniref:hypothetical protein n=1 Tax=Candidatus Pantoea bituminis TaxID=2831036 RepID=UPI00356B6A2D